MSTARPSPSSRATLPAAAQVPTGSGKLNNVVTDGNGNSTVYLQAATVADMLNAIDLATGVQTVVNTAGVAASTARDRRYRVVCGGQRLAEDLDRHQQRSNITGTGNALAALGLNGNQGKATTFSAARTAAAGGSPARP